MTLYTDCPLNVACSMWSRGIVRPWYLGHWTWVFSQGDRVSNLRLLLDIGLQPSTPSLRPASTPGHRSLAKSLRSPTCIYSWIQVFSQVLQVSNLRLLLDIGLQPSAPGLKPASTTGPRSTAKCTKSQTCVYSWNQVFSHVHQVSNLHPLLDIDLTPSAPGLKLASTYGPRSTAKCTRSQTCIYYWTQVFSQAPWVSNLHLLLDLGPQPCAPGLQHASTTQLGLSRVEHLQRICAASIVGQKLYWMFQACYYRPSNRQEEFLYIWRRNPCAALMTNESETAVHSLE